MTTTDEEQSKLSQGFPDAPYISVRPELTTPVSSPLRRKTTPKSSSYFEPAQQLKSSCLVFPSLRASAFGLTQERFSSDPFRLLVTVIFLNQTKGAVSIPYCDALFDVFPTAEDFAHAQPEALVNYIRPLGLQNRRAETIIKLAKAWVESPPQMARRYRKRHYPAKGDGKDISRTEQPLTDADPRSAWEIAHLPGVGAYAIDSWRIFCRDTLRGLHSGITALESEDDAALEMQQEWTRVVPLDKELRAYLRWRWLRLGWLWDPVTNERIHVEKEVIRQMESKQIRAYHGYTNPWILDLDLGTESVTRSPSVDDAVALDETLYLLSPECKELDKLVLEG